MNGRGRMNQVDGEAIQAMKKVTTGFFFFLIGVLLLYDVALLSAVQ